MSKPLKTPESKEAVKMLYMELGPSEAARRLGKPINTITKWASRYGWVTKTVTTIPRPKPNECRSVVKPSDALVQSIKETGTATKGAIAAAVLKAAEGIDAAGIPICSASHLKDLTTAAARVFGWDQGQGSGNTYNTLVVTAEQLDQIRALRA